MRRWLKAHSAKLRFWLEVVSYAGGVVGLFLIALQLTSDARKRRVDNALEQVARFNTEPLATYKAELLKPWIESQALLREARLKGGLDPQQADSMRNYIFDKYRRENPGNRIDLAVHEIADFYIQLSICRRSGNCHPGVIDEYFGSYATQFYCSYGEQLEAQARDFQTPALTQGVLALRNRRDCAPPQD